MVLKSTEFILQYINCYGDIAKKYKGAKYNSDYKTVLTTLIYYVIQDKN